MQSIEQAQIIALKKGQIDALDFFIRAYTQRLLRIAQLAGATLLDAEELVQDTFIQLWKKHAELREDHPIYPFLKIILINKLRDLHTFQIRRGKDITSSLSMNNIFSETQEDLLVADSKYAPDRAFEEEETHTQIEQALADLSPEMRETFMLCVIDSLSYEQIAEKMGCQIGTVKSRIARARAHLIDVLKLTVSLYIAISISTLYHGAIK